MERAEAKTLSMAALQYARNGAAESAALIIEALAGTGDPRDLYAACCGWAGSSEVALEMIHGERSSTGMWTPQEIHPGELTDQPERAFAARFISAYSNGDSATTEALFVAALKANSDQLAGSLGSLLQMAADLNAEAYQA
jgi:hypothetical protein